MAKPSPYRPGEAEWRSSPLVQALISAVWTTKINNPSFFLLGLLPYKNQRPPLVLYKMKAQRSLVVVGLVLLIQGQDAQQISVFLLMRLLTSFLAAKSQAGDMVNCSATDVIHSLHIHLGHPPPQPAEKVFLGSGRYPLNTLAFGISATPKLHGSSMLFLRGKMLRFLVRTTKKRGQQ